MPRKAEKPTRRRPSAAIARVGPIEVDPDILLIRGQRVLLDTRLAQLYGVTTKALNQAVRRNLDRFPADFMFQLEWDELAAVRRIKEGSEPSRQSRSQTVTLKRGSNVKYRAFAFTEQGVAMLSSVLRSKRAVAVNIEIMRAFVRLRQLLHANHDLARRLDDLVRKFTRRTDEHAAHIARIYELLDALMNPPDPPKKGRIGFRIAEPEGT